MVTNKDIYRWIAEGHAADEDKHAAKEGEKLGHFRGGTCGIVIGDDTVGKCPRIAYLRSVGIDTPVDANTREMFAFGLASEDIVLRLLRQGTARVDPELEVTEGETARFEWALADGTKITGTPDIILETPEGRVAGIELKAVCSIWTALGVHYDLRPKSDHLIQAGHYSAKMGKLPWFLAYSSRVDWHVSTAPGWLRAKFQEGVHDVEFKDNGTPLKIRPFNRVYELTWSDDGHLVYHTEGMSKPCKTEITEERIEAYYSKVAEIRDSKVLGARPSQASVDGSKSFNPCGYCDLAAVCDKYETGEFDTWMDHVRLTIAEAKGG